MWLKGKAWKLGSPPHTRGKYLLRQVVQLRERITPAYAGKIQISPANSAHTADHPRIRGENLQNAHLGAAPAGSPPHTRGK